MTGNLNPSYYPSGVVPGVTDSNDAFGNQKKLVPGSYDITTANFVVHNNSTPSSPSQEIIAGLLYKNQLYKATEVSERPFPWLDTPASSASKLFLDLQLTEAKFEIYNEVSVKLEQERRRQECLDKAAAAVRKNSETAWQGVLNTVVQESLNLILQQINKAMPPEYQVAVSVEPGPDGSMSFKGLSVGDIVYDPINNAVAYKGDVFNATANQGLQSVNKLLPSFLQLRLDNKALGLGNVSVKLSDLSVNPGTSFPLGGNISAKNEGGVLVVSVGQTKSEVGLMDDLLQGAAGAAVDRYARPGLASLNRVLPSGLKVSLDTSKGATNPTLRLGPVGLELASGGLVFDNAGALNLLNSQVESYGFSQLPPPASAVARSVWKALDVGDMLGLNKPNTSPDPKSNLALKDTCDGQATLPATPVFTPYVPPNALNKEISLPEPIA